jgi:cytochrome P450
MTKSPASLFSDPSFKADPYPFYARLRDNTPVHKTLLPNGVEVYLVTRYEDVQAGLKNSRLVKNIYNARRMGMLAKLGFGALMSNSNMLRADPPEHTRLRALAHEAFTPKYVNHLRGRIQQIADDLVDAVQQKGKMDLIGEFAFPLPITVICEMLGVPAQDGAKFRQWSGALIASGTLSNETIYPTPALFRLLSYVRQLVTERQKTPRDDLISELVHIEQNGDRFTKVELVGTTLVLLIAGHETTVNLIGNGILALLQHPKQLKQLQQSPSLIKPAIEELLRYVNPVQAVHRYAAQDIEIGGVPIAKGSHLLLVLAAANHDAAYVGNPEQLDVMNDDPKHVAFGQGIHYCLGAPLARLEGEIAFTTLLNRLPNIHLDIAPEDIEWRSGIELRGLQSLPVAF